jgi:CRP-like cAMP-binding protein
MTNLLIRKLSRVIKLSDDDERLLTSLCGNTRQLPAKRDIIREGDRPDHVRLVLEGWAGRYKVLPSGARQITAFLIPGDFCDLHFTIIAQMDHSITALSAVTVADVPHDALEELAQSRPDLSKALWWTTLTDEAVLRAWIVSLGRRNACERIAHLICEVHVRLSHIGLVEDDRFHMPLTQEDLGDALGLTTVHCNRTLKKLHKEGWIEWRRGAMTIIDLKSLRTAAGFDPDYLHGGTYDVRRDRDASASKSNSAKS